MGKGRAACCDKSKVKKGPWTPPEDLKLISFIQKHGHGNWRALPKQAGLLRCGKSCRLRWINYLRPDVKRGNFTPQEEDIIINLHHSFGNRWSKIASHLSGRTDNEIKNVWNTYLKKRMKKDEECNMKNDSSPSSLSSTLIPPPSIHDHIITSNQEELGDDNNKKQYVDTSSAGWSCSPTTTTTSSSYASLHLDLLSMDNVSSAGTDKIDFREMMLDTPINLDMDSTTPDHEYSQLEVAHYTTQATSDRHECQKWLRYLEIELGLITSYQTNNDNEQRCDDFTSPDQNNFMQV